MTYFRKFPEEAVWRSSIKSFSHNSVASLLKNSKAFRLRRIIACTVRPEESNISERRVLFCRRCAVSIWASLRCEEIQH
ncbi:unnamed protein product, partial [Nesidiocoris tenuis]